MLGFRCWRLFLPLLVLAVGCGKDKVDHPPLALVSGRVLLDDRPLAKALVRFQPAERESGKFVPDSYGETDEQGYFSLRAVLEKGDADGAVIGLHRVQITLFDREAEGGPRELVPAKFNRDSKLTFTVPAGGTKEAHFNLTSK